MKYTKNSKKMIKRMINEFKEDTNTGMNSKKTEIKS
jgi:hypothetical protein